MRWTQEAEPTPTKGGVTNTGAVWMPFVTSQTVALLLSAGTLVKLPLTFKGKGVVWHYVVVPGCVS